MCSSISKTVATSCHLFIKEKERGREKREVERGEGMQ